VGIERIIREPSGDRKPTPVLFLHGAWHGAWCYDLWLDDFAAHGYEAHAISLPAHGGSGSTRPLHLHGLRDYVSTLAAIVGQVTPTPFVVGHSLGGYVLQRYLRDHRLPGAVLLAPVPVLGALPLFWRMLKKHPVRFIWGGLSLNPRRWVGTPALVTEYFVSDGAVCPPEAISARLDNESVRAGIESCFALWRTARTVKAARQPVLVVAAGNDSMFPLSEEQATARAFGADYLVIEGQGHDLMLERDWQQVAAHIRNWFEAIGSTSGST
jgi:pimeloyl-ACP methyl ester carboxylesterase